MVIELIQLHPRISIVIISAAVSLFISIVNFLVLDKEKVRASKSRTKEIQKLMKEHKEDQKKQAELTQELLKHNLENMKNSFKPMLITIIPVLAVFWWIRGTFADTLISGSWFWYYLVATIIFSLIFRKIFKLP